MLQEHEYVSLCLLENLICIYVNTRVKTVIWKLIAQIYKWVIHWRLYKNKSNFQINIKSVFLFKNGCNSYITVCLRKYSDYIIILNYVLGYNFILKLGAWVFTAYVWKDTATEAKQLKSVVVVVCSHCLLECELPVWLSSQQRKWVKQWYSLLFFQSVVVLLR